MHVMDIDFDLLVIKLPWLELLASANLAVANANEAFPSQLMVAAAS